MGIFGALSLGGRSCQGHIGPAICFRPAVAGSPKVRRAGDLIAATSLAFGRLRGNIWLAGRPALWCHLLTFFLSAYSVSRLERCYSILRGGTLESVVKN